MIRAALAYAKLLRWRVLPVEPRGKRPITNHGVHEATVNEAQIRTWWNYTPQANVAIAAGPGVASSEVAFFVVDVDVRNGGDQSLAELIKAWGPLPPTVTARTGGGGWHYLFKLPPGMKLRGKLARGVDLLGAGRYFLVSPSVHPSGGVYAWEKDGHPVRTPIASAPSWLLDLAHVVEAQREPVPSAGSNPASTNVLERARKYVAGFEPAISGQGGHTVTFKLATRLVHGFGLDEGTALALMETWNAGCQPPWKRFELVRKVREAMRKGRMDHGALRDAPRRTGT